MLPNRACIASPLRGGAAPAPSSQMVISQPSRQGREAVHAARRPSSTHRHATSSASTRKLSTSQLHFHSSKVDKKRAKRACLHTFPSTGAWHSLTNHSTHAESSQPAHAQRTHATFATPPTAEMQFGAACQRMCSGMRTQDSLTMHLQHVRVLASQLVAEDANRGELEVSTQNFSR